MKAHARIVAGAGPGGATVLAELRGEPPLLPRVTGPRGGAVAEVHLVGGAAAQLGGDELFIDVEVGPGASLVLRTVAATLALPGPDGAPSSMTVRVSIAAGGHLEFLPEPVIAAARCHHHALSTVELEAGASLRWREELVAGRHGETPGHLRATTRLRYDQQTILAQELTLGDGVWTSPAVVGASRTVGTVLIVDPSRQPCAAAGSPVAARMPLGGPTVLCGAVAPDLPTLRRRLADVIEGAGG